LLLSKAAAPSNWLREPSRSAISLPPCDFAAFKRAALFAARVAVNAAVGSNEKEAPGA
jgi:hypothetical protein